MDLDELKDKWDNMSDWVVVLLVILLMLFVLGVITVYDSCGKVDMDEYLNELVEMEDGSYICIIHSWSCKDKCLDKETYKPKMQWFEDINNILSFRKQQNDVFHYCVDSNEAIILNSSSRRNLEMSLIYDEFTDEEIKLLDFSDRTYNIYYSIKNGKLIKLPKNKRKVSDFK